jgi:hypothetical protein
MSAAITFVPAVSAATNSTNGSPGNDVVNGIETWTGSHTLVGNVTVPAGATLKINAGSTITLAAGAALFIDGAICAGDGSCGAAAGGTIGFNWQAPINESQSTWCVDEEFSWDASCGEGIVLNSGIDEAISSIKNVAINNAYGFPLKIGDVKEYAALIFNGASITAEGLSFSGINTSSVLVTNQAAPILSNGAFTVGNDEQGFRGPAISSYTAGKNPQERFTILNSDFTGTALGCDDNSGKLTTIWVTDSHVNFDGITMLPNGEDNADLGIYLRRSAGEVMNSDLTTACNALNIAERRVTEAAGNEIHYPMYVNDTTAFSGGSAAVGIYINGFAYLDNLDISGPAEGSGVSIRSSEVSIINSNIHNVTGYNGLYLYGESDITIHNTKIDTIAREAILLGEYHWNDDNWNTGSSSQPYAARLKVTNSEINNAGGNCDSKTVYGETGNTDGTFACPAVHIYMGSATLWNNTIVDTTADGIRVTGGIVDVRNNTVTAGEYAARVSSFNTKYQLGSRAFSGKYGSIAYFSNNTWNVDAQTYNITESRVAVQSETIPVPSAPGVYSVGLRWTGSAVKCEPNMVTDCLQVPPMYSSQFSKYVYPEEIPMSVELNPNATVFAYADLDIGLENIHIGRLNSGAGKHQNIVQEGELVRYRVLANGDAVSYADITVRDSHGNELYNLTTDEYGMTPQIVLASDFHLDFTGFGVHPDGLVTDPAENSCNDDLDNDGDLLYDNDDPDCQGNGREMSVYFIDAWKFDKGSATESITLTSQIEGVISLSNLAPTVELDVQYPENTAFKRWVNVTGRAYDGNGEIGYSSDWEAMLGHMGTIDRVEIRLPGGSWDDGILATDTSGFTEDTVTQQNWPWRTWSYNIDLSTDPEADYPFEFRSYDGVEYSPIISRSFQLNTVPPTVALTSPSADSKHDQNSVIFRGSASDTYSGVNSPDLHKIHIKFTKEDGSTLPTEEFIPVDWNDWEYEWDFTPHSSGIYTVQVWASDSKFCRYDIGECVPVVMDIEIENENALPIVEIYGPSGDIQGDQQTRIYGYATDLDGDVSRVEVNITHASGGWIELPNIYTFDSSNNWETYWDTSGLDHLSEHTITVRAFDAEDYSIAKSLNVKILNPPEELDPPQFNQTNWDESLNGGTIIKIFCDKGSKSVDKCGTGLEMNLNDFFEHTGDSPLNFNIAGNEEDFNEHDQFMFSVLVINPTGVLTYNPAISAMSTYYSEETQWSFVGVRIRASDTYNQSVISPEFNIIVIAVEFSFQAFHSDEVNSENPAVYIGTGRPGQVVKAYMSSGKISLGEAIVDDEGTWRLEVPRSFFPEDGGNIEIEFEYASNSHMVSGGIAVESPDEGMSLIIIILIIFAVLVVVLGALAYFFVEFEDEDDFLMEQEAEPQKDPYAWGKTNNTQQEVAPQTTSQSMVDSNPNYEAYVQQLISQGYDEPTARAHAEQYRDRF